MNAMDFITWDLWWKNNRYDMVNGETIKMDKFDRLQGFVVLLRRSGTTNSSCNCLQEENIMRKKSVKTTAKSTEAITETAAKVKETVKAAAKSST